MKNNESPIRQDKAAPSALIKSDDDARPAIYSTHQQRSDGSICGGLNVSPDRSVPSRPSQPTSTATAHGGRERERQRALNEAARVLNSCTESHHNLDGFHLLGVVADPRGPAGTQPLITAATAPITPSSFHGRYGTTTAATSADETSTNASSYFLYPSFESTLSSVTGQMEAWNHVLEDWSRHLLEEGDSSYGGGGGLLSEQDIPESQLKELPPEISNPDVTPVANFLEQSGTAASAFSQRISLLPSSNRTVPNGNRERTSVSSDPYTSPPSSSEDDDLIDVTDVPIDFFGMDFDLTDPDTFRKILLLTNDANDDDDIPTTNAAVVNDGDVSVMELLPLLPQDALSGYLDKVELALLQQVRSNSDRFFAESQQFAQLQEWIVGLLDQVVSLQKTTSHLQSDLLQPMEIVPIADAQRSDLRKLELVLERADDMLLCKHSLGGVLSAQDDLTAIEQIQFGRRLLNGTWEDREEISDRTSYHVELGRLHAFRAVSDQLSQYEQLVVTNLRDEIIEIFLSWNSMSNGTTSESVSYGNGSLPVPPAKAAGASSMLSQQEQQIRNRVREILAAMQTCRALTRTRDSYSSRLQDVIRMTVRTTVGEFASDAAPAGAVQSVAMGASSMSLNRFLDCLDMLFEQLLALVSSVSNVDEYFVSEGLLFRDADDLDSTEKENGPIAVSADPVNPPPSQLPTPLSSVIASASELASKSISELLRLRKDAHSLVSLAEMKAIWDTCMTFTLQLEKLSGTGCTSNLRTTLLAQAKSFLERKHESNMSALAAALDSERWVQCDVAAGRQAAVSRLCTGLSVAQSPSKRPNGADTGDGIDAQLKQPDIEAEGVRYKVVWSCLLLVEMVLNNIATAVHFPNLASSNVSKVTEILRLFNSRTTQLVLGAGAIHSHAKLKSINAKHLSLVTQCLGLIMAILPHIRAGLMAQLPKKQHTLLTSLDQIRKEYGEHNEKVLNKFVTIIGGIVEHGLAKTIPGTDFDARAKSAQAANGVISCCVFLDGVATNTRKMHQVLYSLLPPDHLIDTFSRIFAFLDTRVPALFIAAANIQPVFQKPGAAPKVAQVQGQPSFSFPKTEEGKRQFLLEVETMTKSLNSLEGVRAWEFSATNVIGRELEFSLQGGQQQLTSNPSPSASSNEALTVEPNELTAEPDTTNSRIDDNKENGSAVGTDGEGSPDLVAESTDSEPVESDQSADQPTKLSPDDDEARLEAAEG